MEVYKNFGENKFIKSFKIRLWGIRKWNFGKEFFCIEATLYFQVFVCLSLRYLNGKTN